MLYPAHIKKRANNIKVGGAIRTAAIKKRAITLSICPRSVVNIRFTNDPNMRTNADIPNNPNSVITWKKRDLLNVKDDNCQYEEVKNSASLIRGNTTVKFPIPAPKSAVTGVLNTSRTVYHECAKDGRTSTVLFVAIDSPRIMSAIEFIAKPKTATASIFQLSLISITDPSCKHHTNPSNTKASAGLPAVVLNASIVRRDSGRSAVSAGTYEINVTKENNRPITYKIKNNTFL